MGLANTQRVRPTAWTHSKTMCPKTGRQAAEIEPIAMFHPKLSNGMGLASIEECYEKGDTRLRYS